MAHDTELKKKLATMLGTGVLAAGLMAVPASINLADMSIDSPAAFAKGGGESGGNSGESGGNSGGNSGNSGGEHGGNSAGENSGNSAGEHSGNAAGEHSGNAAGESAGEAATAGENGGRRNRLNRIRNRNTNN